jgi:hypothetical protein
VISRFINEATDGESLLMTKDIGTPHWMAPELFTSQQYTNKVDLYAYAILLWEMQTETAPFKGMSGMQIGIAVSRRGERPKLPDDVPGELRELITSCWAQDPEARPSFDDVVKAFAKGNILYDGSDSAEVRSFLNGLKPVLSNSNAEDFETTFRDSVPLLNEENCDDFFSRLAALIKNDTPPARAEFLLRELCPVIEVNPAFFASFVSAGIADLLPAFRDSAPGPLFGLLERVIVTRPVLLTNALLVALAPLISTGYADATIRLLVPVLRFFDQMPNGWVASDHLITFGGAFIAASPLLYMNTLYYMLSTFPTYREARFAYVVPILMEGLLSPDLEAVRVIYSIFIAFYQPELVFDAAFLLRDLRREDLVDCVLSFLTIQTSIVLTVDIVNCLLSIVREKGNAFVALAAACERDVGAREAMLAIGGSWIADGRLSLQQVLALLGNVVVRREARPVVAGFPELIQLFGRVMCDVNPQSIDGLGIVIARLPASVELFQRLTAVGFFARFFPAVVRSQDELVIRSGVCIVDAFSRIIFAREFLMVVPILLTWLVAPDEGKAVRALSALASLVRHEEGRRTLTTIGFDVRLLNRFRANPHYGVYLAAFGVVVN